jgi:hypothetical protein
MPGVRPQSEADEMNLSNAPRPHCNSWPIRNGPDYAARFRVRTIVRKRLGAIASTSGLPGAYGGELLWRRSDYQLAYETARIRRQLA